MVDFLPDGLPTFKVVNEVLKLTGFKDYSVLFHNKLKTVRSCEK